MCIEGRYLNGDQRFKVVFSSLKNVAVHSCSHSASKTFVHEQKSCGGGCHNLIDLFLTYGITYIFNNNREGILRHLPGVMHV